MTNWKDAKDMVTKQSNQVRWIKLVVAVIGLIALSYGFAALLEYLKSRFNLNFYEFETVAYISVFVASLLANLTIIAPVPFAVAIMASAARDFNPILVALCGATGGSLGELSGYYAGRLGKRIAIPDSIIGYKKIELWLQKYGVWAIMALAFQPIIPFDVGGLFAGATKMPLHKFLPALWIGKFPKYVLMTYAGLGIINFFPSWMDENNVMIYCFIAVAAAFIWLLIETRGLSIRFRYDK
jgi:membrane protein YqaA with SNARE-associated domain